ncbi:MAG TPA: helix-turn-helix transcriptional regulator [Chloroflexota bacterium]|nr:helix-turn-helix transcriptional regulator [Chloroflexota bacterium]
MATHFAKGLRQWRADTGLSLRGQARLIGCSPSYLVKLQAGDGAPSGDFMSRCIANVNEPWASVLRQSRQRDIEAADATAVGLLVA